MNIEGFVINKLHGVLDYELKFKDNTLILIGENGSCKTTIIKMLFYTLSMQWGKLLTYNFENVILKFETDEIILSKKEINSVGIFDHEFLRRLPPPIQSEIRLMMNNESFFDISKLEFICRRYDYPIDHILRKIDFIDDNVDIFTEQRLKGKNKEFSQKIAKLKEVIGESYILYLPTYRRIEQELKDVLEGKIDENEYRMRKSRISKGNYNYSELIEFGMNDVIELLAQELNSLKDLFRTSLNSLTLEYLGDIVDEKYNKVDISQIKDVDEATIHNIMNRVDLKILSENSKAKLLQTLQTIRKGNSNIAEHDKVVCHYFIKLLNSHRSLEQREIQIKSFRDVCAKYLQNKEFIYDSSNFTFSILSNTEKKQIEPHQLSSGEKQIVSLFSQLYLSGKSNYFVLIDEPELSLSVKWQRLFLVDIKNGGFCNGLVAVTHSPFIFDNELDIYAHGLGEFSKQ